MISADSTLYERKFVLRYTAGGRDIEWTGTAWLPYKGKLYPVRADALGQMDAALAALPSGAPAPHVATVTFLAPRTTGIQPAFPLGPERFSVLPGGATPRQEPAPEQAARPLPRGPFAPPEA